MLHDEKKVNKRQFCDDSIFKVRSSLTDSLSVHVKTFVDVKPRTIATVES